MKKYKQKIWYSSVKIDFLKKLNMVSSIFKSVSKLSKKNCSLFCSDIINKCFDKKNENPCLKNETENFLEQKDCYSKKNSSGYPRRVIKEISRILKVGDIILLLVDCRDPIGSWFKFSGLGKVRSEKKFLLILNKSDLVPSWVTKKWLKIFSKDFPVVAFHSTNKKPFGKKSLINIIKQIKKSFFSKKKEISIGILGYPNVGKSSLINTLKGKKVSLASSKAGETKVWKFINLFKNTYLIDSPGLNFSEVLHPEKKILKGENPSFKTNENLCKIINLVETMIDPSSKISKSVSERRVLLTGRFFKKRTEYSFLGKGGSIEKLTNDNQLLKNFFIGEIPWYSPIPFSKKRKKKKNFWKIMKNLPSSDGRATDS